MNPKNVTITAKIVLIPIMLITMLISVVYLTFNAFNEASNQFGDIDNELKIIEDRENIKDNIFRMQLYLLINTIQSHSMEHEEGDKHGHNHDEDKNLNLIGGVKVTESIENYYNTVTNSIKRLEDFITADYKKHSNEHSHEDENRNVHDEDLHLTYLKNLVSDFDELKKRVVLIHDIGENLPKDFSHGYESGIGGIDKLFTISNEIELYFKKLEGFTDENYHNMSKDFNSKLEKNKSLFITIGVIGVILSLILSILIVKSIKSSISTLKNGVLNFFDFLNTKSQKAEFIPLKSKDEFGIMAKIINENIEKSSKNILENIEVVKQVAIGDYTVKMAIKGENDTFAKSMNAMIEKLRENKKSNDEQSWIKDGLNELNNKLTGDLTTFEISNRSIEFVCNYLKAGIGALYIHKRVKDESILKLFGSYAFIEREEVSSRYRLGEGVIGQVALQKSPILLKNIKRSQLVITTGTTSETPINSYTYPLIYEEELYGVIEIASHTQFSKIELEFLNSSNRIIATYLFTSEQNEKIKKLFEDSKKANEELKNSNELMNIQQKRLEESNAQMEEQQQQLEETNAQMEEQQQQLEEANAQMEEQQQQLEEVNAELEERQQQLQTSSEELKTKNASLMKSQEELDKRAKELEASNKYKSEFLANMSHELRTPLNSIILLSKMLTKNKEKHLDEKEVKKVTVINQAGNELLRLINDILDLSKVEAGKMSLNPSQISTKSLLGQFHDMFEHTAVEKNLKFIINDEVNTIFVNDEDKLSQIIRNLLSNAFKFTKEGYIELGVVDSGNIDRPIEFYVKDSGIGIPKEKQKLIFEAFSQADGSTSREYGGTGLGLSITREFAKLMNAKVKLESIEGKGSRFSIILPKSIQGIVVKEEKNKSIVDSTKEDIKEVVEEINQEQKVVDDRESISFSDSVMLIIEDDINFSEILKERVNAKGLKVLIAQTGEVGVELAKKYDLTGILLDLGLPDINGVEVLRELKNDVKTKHIPVHIISGQNREVLPQKLGAVGFIQKPAKEEDIDIAIQKLSAVTEKSPKHILIVEDDKNQQDAIISLIEQKGIELKAVDSVANSIEELNKNIYDTIIIDLGLKEGDGYEICDYIKNNGIETPIIIYTGKDLNEDEIDRLRQYTDSIILKTANSDERLLEDIDLFLHNVKSKTNSSKEEQKEKTQTLDLDVDLSGKNILVVDDDAKNIFVLSSALEEQGAEIVDAKNGEVALEVLRENSDIDLVLMDIMMPVMNGYEAIAEIRKDESLKHLPVIAVTAKAMKDDRDKCIDAGADDYISKPLDLDLLTKMVKAWVNKNHN